MSLESDWPRPATGGRAGVRRRGNWLRVAAGLLICLLLLIGFAPTLAGGPMARALVMGTVGPRSSGGRLDIGDCSIGWFTGLRASGVRLWDPNNSKLLDIRQVATDYSLWRMMWGSGDLGNVTVENLDFDLRVRTGGATNFSGPAGPGSSDQARPAGIPAGIRWPYRGVIRFIGCSGTWRQEVPIHAHDPRYVVIVADLDQIEGTISIPDASGPVGIHLKISGRPMNGPTGTLDVDGSLSLLRNGRVDLTNPTGDCSVEAENLDAGVWAPVVSSLWKPVRMSGRVGGKVTASATRPEEYSASGSLQATDALFGGEAMGGETIAYRQMRVAFSDAGSGFASAARMKLDWSLTATPKGKGDVLDDRLSMWMDAPARDLGHVSAAVADAIGRSLSESAASEPSDRPAVEPSGGVGQTRPAGFVSINVNFDPINLLSLTRWMERSATRPGRAGRIVWAATLREDADGKFR